MGIRASVRIYEGAYNINASLSQHVSSRRESRFTAPLRLNLLGVGGERLEYETDRIRGGRKTRILLFA